VFRAGVSAPPAARTGARWGIPNRPRESLTEGVPQFCVDQLIQALAQVTDERVVRYWFLDGQSPAQVGPAAAARQVEADNGVRSLGPD